MSPASAVHPGALRPTYAVRLRGPVALALLLGLAAVFLFADRTPMAIVLWDESRTMVNALEMAGHWSVVTTYGGAPDLWNTKPPLAIWAMALSVEVLGAGEGALRLPSALAALGTLGLVAGFVRRTTRSTPAAATAAAILLLSPGFFGQHAARTADYDAPLTFFVTACLMTLFGIVHRTRPSRRALALATTSGAAALMVKGIAAPIALAGVPLYAVIVGRGGRLRAPSVILAAGAAMLPVAAWLAVREAQAPGFVAAMWRNDMGGRYAASLVGDAKPVGFYLSLLASGYLAAPAMLAAVPLALAGRTLAPRARLALVFTLCVAVGQLAVISAAASKLSHYALPALPFLAAATAIALHALARRFPTKIVAAATCAALVVATAAAVPLRYRIEPASAAEGAGGYGALLAAVAPSRRTLVVWDAGKPLYDWPHYAPVLDAYRLIWARRGVAIRRIVARPTAAGDTPIASCDPRVVPYLRRTGRTLAETPGCVAILAVPPLAGVAP